MPSTPFDNSEFRALKAKWYKKLEKDGFEDIEQEDGNLKLWASHYFRVRYRADTAAAKEEYYRLARSFLFTHKFKTKKDRTIWELHSEGLSFTEITEEMKRRRFKVYRSRIYEIASNLAKEMLEQCRKTT